jgi:hypothetical protein
MIRFGDFTAAESASAVISAAREQLRVKPEFKFRKACDAVRDAFFEAVVPLRFSVRSIVVAKARVYSSYLRAETDAFYGYFVQQMLRHDGGTLAGARVKIDGSGDRKLKHALSAYLRRQLGDRIASVKFANSKSDNLIQLADMCAGAIARSYKEEDRHRPNRWLRQLRPRIEDIWEFR